MFFVLVGQEFIYTQRWLIDLRADIGHDQVANDMVDSTRLKTKCCSVYMTFLLSGEGLSAVKHPNEGLV